MLLVNFIKISTLYIVQTIGKHAIISTAKSIAINMHMTPENLGLLCVDPKLR